jgi:uncharacterized OsmC-like protein
MSTATGASATPDRHHVTVRLTRDFEFAATFDDLPTAPAIRFDEPPPLGHHRAPNAVDVLSAAVGNCLAASLTFCLRKARVDVRGLTAHVTTDVERNDKGRFRIRHIDVELSPELGDAPLNGVTRCEGLFEDFCTVTASVRRGIPVTVSLRERPESDVPAPVGSGGERLS